MNIAEKPTYTKPMLCNGILEIMRDNWTLNTGSFDAFWYGYEALKDCLWEKGIRDVTIKDLKQAMKELSKQGLVKLKPSYDVDYTLSGHGWYACT
jgi:hypothetical protein